MYPTLFYLYSQIDVACGGGGGSGEIVTVVTAKVEIWRIPVVLQFSHPMINGSIDEQLFYCYR